MKKVSIHSQDYDRKHGNDHDVKDKAQLKEDFIENKRKDSSKENPDHLGIRGHVESK
ncbi:MAG: hypothetical protein ACSLFL_01885 [Alphaproteobacteria bacterium]